jgi:hypothetical protein
MVASGAERQADRSANPDDARRARSSALAIGTTILMLGVAPHVPSKDPPIVRRRSQGSPPGFISLRFDFHFSEWSIYREVTPVGTKVATF